MEDLNLKPGHTYLLRYGCTDTLSEVKVLLETDKAYQVKWQSGNITWELKSRMNSDYTVVEDITIIAKDLPFDWLKDNFPEFKSIKFPHFYVEDICDICGGSGHVECKDLTSCYKTCPACNGSGKKSKKVTLSFD
jgi:hypothetical protein